MNKEPEDVQMTNRCMKNTFSITGHQGNESLNHTSVRQEMTSVARGGKKRKPKYTIVGK